MTLQMNSYEVLDNNRTTDRKLSMELLDIPQREGSWNWPRRPGKLVWKRSSLFLWKKFYHRLPK